MQERLSYPKFHRLQPAIAEGLGLIHEAVATSLDPQLVHLIHYRVSQINGCAFCQHMHAAEARQDGEQQERLDMLAGWHDAPGFSTRERLALAWAEALTRIADAPVDDELYGSVKAEFGDKGMIDLTAEVLIINSWNRIAISNRFMPKLAAQ